MSDRVERFEIAEAPALRVKLPAGTLRIVAGAPRAMTLRLSGNEATQDRFSVDQEGDTVIIEPVPGRRGRWSRLVVTVEVGEPLDLRARVGSCDITAATDLAGIQVEGASGDVRVGRVLGDVVVRAASGGVKARAVEGDVRVTVASGDVRIGDAGGELDITSASGDIEIGKTLVEAKLKSASGDARIGRFESGDLVVKTLSGSVKVGIPPGRSLDVDLDTLSGRVRTEFEVSEGANGSNGSAGRLAIKTLSGNITLGSADLV